MSQQLSLNVRLKDGSSFSNFFPGPNQEVLAQLRAAIVAVASGGKGAEKMLFLWGADGSGKSHLLQAACRLAQELGLAPVYVPLAEAEALAPSLLEDAEQAPLVCLDDMDRIAGQAEWEAALFSLTERMRARGGIQVCAARVPPAQMGLRLPDLTSRLSWGTVYALQSLSDADKLEAVRWRARNRGFEIPEEVAQYILSRYPRDMHSLFDLLDRIDRASLAHQRRVTIPFLRALEGMGNANAGTGTVI
jgi:DnaA family protein